MTLGANPNVQDQRGNTPLHYAMERECILVLLHYGASYSIKNQQGKTAIETNAGQMNYRVYEEFPVAAKLKALRMEHKELDAKRKDLTRELMAIRAKKTAAQNKAKVITMFSEYKTKNNNSVFDIQGPIS